MVADQFLDRDLSLGKRSIRQLLVADLPLENVIMVLSRAVRAGHLVFDIFAQQWCLWGHRSEWIDKHRQLFVFDLDRLCAIGGGVAILCNDERDLLVLKQNFPVGENHLHVAGQRRHPGEVHTFQLFRRQHSEHTGHFERGASVNLLHSSMGVGAAHKISE